MLEPHPELSNDLDWMLQSGQATPEMLLNALVAEYDAPLQRLALAYLDQDELAARAVRDTFSSALLDLHSYRAEFGAMHWLYAIALKVLRRTYLLQRAKAFFRPPQARPPKEEPAEGEAPPPPPVNRLLSLAVDDLPERARLPFLLRFLQGWPEAEIARLLDTSEASIQEQLELARYWLLEALKGQELNTDRLDDQLIEAVQARWPMPEPTRENMQGLAADVLASVGKRSARLRRALPVREALLVGLGGLVIVLLIWGANALTPSLEATPALATSPPAADLQRLAVYRVQPGDTLESIADDLGVPVSALRPSRPGVPMTDVQPGQQIYIRLDQLSTAEAPATPLPSAPPPQALSMKSSSEEILQRLVESSSFWQNVWVDAQAVDYGPPSYRGPPAAQRLQAWVRQPGQSFELHGVLGEDPGASSLVTGGLAYRSTLGETPSLALEAVAPGALLSGSPALHEMLFPDQSAWVTRPGAFQPTGEEQAARRAALLVDWFNEQGGREARLWVDAVTGVVLRWQQFADLDLQTVVSDVVVTAIDYDHTLREGLFDPQIPWQGGFALDEQALPPTADATPAPLTWAAPPDLRRLLPYAPPPAGLDPSGSWLTFQYAGEGEMNQPLTGQSIAPMELFADGFSLGKTDFGLPWAISCARSPDGERLAYSLHPGADEGEGGVSWLMLSDLANTYRLLPGLQASRFAFSPDSRWLAVAGTGGGGVQSGVYLVDIGNGESKLLREMTSVTGLAWSPDGRTLALVGREPGLDTAVMVVVQASNGVEIFRDEDVPSNGQPRPDWPTQEWDIPFPGGGMGDMQACAAPPGL